MKHEGNDYTCNFHFFRRSGVGEVNCISFPEGTGGRFEDTNRLDVRREDVSFHKPMVE